MSSKVNRHVIIIIIIIIDLSLNSLCFLNKFFNKQLTKAITIVEFKQKKQQPILLQALQFNEWAGLVCCVINGCGLKGVVNARGALKWRRMVLFEDH